jgi:hypothetical protein
MTWYLVWVTESSTDGGHVCYTEGTSPSDVRNRILESEWLTETIDTTTDWYFRNVVKTVIQDMESHMKNGSPFADIAIRSDGAVIRKPTSELVQRDH